MPRFHAPVGRSSAGRETLRGVARVLRLGRPSIQLGGEVVPLADPRFDGLLTTIALEPLSADDVDGLPSEWLAGARRTGVAETSAGRLGNEPPGWHCCPSARGIEPHATLPVASECRSPGFALVVAQVACERGPSVGRRP